MSAGIQRRPLPGITTLIEKFPLILFFALLVWLSLQSPFFLSWQNISMMLVQSVPLAILCFGLVCVIAVGGDDVVSGGIDLSLPAIAVLGVALLSLGMAEWNTPYLALLLLLIAVSLACGAVNATLVLAAGLPPLLATLSTSVAFTGLTDLLTDTKLPVGQTARRAFDWLKLHGAPLFDAVAAVLDRLIVAIETVSAARTSRSACLAGMPARSSGVADSVYPKTNARAIATAVLRPLPHPRAVAAMSPTISPMAHPVRQCSVADAAIDDMS